MEHAVQSLGETLWSLATNYTDSPPDMPLPQPQPQPQPPPPALITAMGMLLCILLLLTLLYVVRSTIFHAWETAKWLTKGFFWLALGYIGLVTLSIVFPRTPFEHALLAAWALIEHYMAFTGLPQQMRALRTFVIALYSA